MKKFDENYVLVKDMVGDDYYPQSAVSELQSLINSVVGLLESGETRREVIQYKLDEMTLGINGLQDEFYRNDSEIETIARDSIADTIGYILKWFDIDIDIETAIREREW